MQQYMVTVERQRVIMNFGFFCDDPITSSAADNWQPTAGDPYCTWEVTDQRLHFFPHVNEGLFSYISYQHSKT